MGIDTSIRDALRCFWAKAAFKYASSVKLYGHVEIEDCLIRLLHSRGPNFDHKMTGIEFFKMFMDPIRRAFRERGCKVYVAIVDDETNKSSKKAKTQMKRAKAQAKSKPGVLPYPSTVKIVDDGIYDSATKRTEKLDMERLRTSKFLRPKLWAYVADLMRDESYADGQLLIFEHSKNGPEFFPSVHHWPSDCPKPASFFHDHSEADPATVFWTRVFRKYQVAVQSTDTDLIPIFARAIAAQGKENLPQQLYWLTGNDSAVDIHMMIEEGCSSLDLTPELFELYCIVCGTDYVGKELYAHGFGCLPILHAFRRSRAQMQEILTAMKTGSEQGWIDPKEKTEIIKTNFKYFLRCLYEYGRKREVAEQMRKLSPEEEDDLGKFASSCSKKRKAEMLAEDEDDEAVDDEIGPVKKKSKGGGGKANTVPDRSSLPKVLRTPPEFDKVMEGYKNKKKFQIPSEENLDEAIENIEWNYNFWSKQAEMIITDY